MLSIFGSLVYDECDDLYEYFRQLNFNETQKQAYLDAREEYLKEAENLI